LRGIKLDLTICPMGDWMKLTCPSGVRRCMDYWYVSFIIRFPKLIIPQYFNYIYRGKLFA
jgi:hypothetical protein